MSIVEITASTVEPLHAYVQKASDGTALTGSSNLRVQIRRASDGYFLDFNDATFKASGWTTRQATLTEVSSSNDPGWYRYSTGVDTTGWTAGSYFVTFLETSTTLALGAPSFATGEIRIVTAKASDLSARLPSSLVSGRIDASVGAVASGAIDATAIASGALTAAKFGAAAITSTVLADDAITAAKIAADAIGSSELAASAANEIADALLDRALSGHATSGTAGEALGRLDVAVSTRAAPGAAMDLIEDALDASAVATSAVTEIQSGLASASGLSSVASAVAALPSASAISAAVVDQALSGHTGSGSVGEALSRLDATVSSRSTLTAANVWNTALPDGFSSGSAGYLVGTYLDATVSSRLAGASYVVAPSASAVASQVLGTAVPGAFASGSLGYVVGTFLDLAVSTRLAASSYTVAPSAATVAGAVWEEALAGHTTAGTAGGKLYGITAAPSANVVAAAVWATAEGTPTDGTFGYDLQLLRKGLTNRLESSAGTPGLLKLYNDDGVTLLLTWQLRDKDGGAVTASAGEPSKRGAAA